RPSRGTRSATHYRDGMRTVRAIVAITATALGLAVLAMQPASAADPLQDAKAALRASALYVDPSLTDLVKLQTDKVGSAIPDAVKIAVLPTSAGSATALAKDI